MIGSNLELRGSSLPRWTGRQLANAILVRVQSRTPGFSPGWQSLLRVGDRSQCNLPMEFMPPWHFADGRTCGSLSIKRPARRFGDGDW